MEISLKDMETDKLEKSLNRMLATYENQGVEYVCAPIGYRPTTKKLTPYMYETTGCEVRMYNADYAFTDFAPLIDIATVNPEACYRYEENGEYEYVDRTDAVKYAAEKLRFQFL